MRRASMTVHWHASLTEHNLHKRTRYRVNSCGTRLEKFCDAKVPSTQEHWAYVTMDTLSSQ